ncbi:hypothetical protein NST36_19070 [Bacillus sp. FSL R5-0293]|uniref:hypothetical protein n=1 Tax=Bacillus sp. FSL R5-0293 TaxID=2954584 RepID=UPI0030F8114D
MVNIKKDSKKNQAKNFFRNNVILVLVALLVTFISGFLIVLLLNIPFDQLLDSLQLKIDETKSSK